MKPELTASVLLLLAATAAAQTEYTGDGTPTERSEEIRWHLNRGRSNPSAENTLRGTSYNDVSAGRPVAPNEILATASRYHAIDLATKNLFEHKTVTNSAYFNWAAHHSNSIADFSERANDLGYTITGGGAENITGGYSTALSAYLSWWNSTGHRTGMYNTTRREIGLGYSPRVGSSLYTDYDVMKIAAQNSASGSFFTDTLFRDANSNNLYGSGEGVRGIKIELTNNGAAHTSFDVSSAVGSFAISLGGINAGNSVQVFLTNTSGSAATLSIPASHSTLNTLNLSAGQRWLLGTFTRATDTNAGFRNLTFATIQPLSVPTVNISTATGKAVISFQSQTGHTYQVQWSADLAAPWTNLGALQNGNNAVLSVTDPASTTSPTRRFYKVIVTSP